MACDCIEQMRKRGNAVLHVTKTDTGERFSLGAPYRPTMEEGKKVVEYVANFCPICGKAYDSRPFEDTDLVLSEWNIINGDKVRSTIQLICNKKNGTATIYIEVFSDTATIKSVNMKDIPDIDSKERYFHLIVFFTKYLKKELNMSNVKVTCYSSWQVEMCHRIGYTIWQNPLQSNFCLIMMI